jgi:glycosyltransferase involved in cell wall biosynthesis
MSASWEKAELPDPALMSEAVESVMDNYRQFSDAARQRAVDLFSLDKFIQAHRRVFEKALAG